MTGHDHEGDCPLGMSRRRLMQGCGATVAFALAGGGVGATTTASVR
ncbi:hypothetical protein [Natronomonas sp.]